MADYIKGLNVRNALKQAGAMTYNTLKNMTPAAYAAPTLNTDYDVLDNYSVAGGERSPYDGSYYGLTYAPTQTDNIPQPQPAPTDPTAAQPTAPTQEQMQQQQQWQTDYTNYLNQYLAQFQPLYDKYISDLQSGYNTNRGNFDYQYGQSRDKLMKNYWDLANQNDKGYYNNLKNTESAYAGRNLQDSSFYNNSMGEINSNFKDYYGKINQQKDEGIGSLDKQKNDYYSQLDKTLSTGRETADRIRNNFYNPQTPQFGSLEELYSAKSGLDSQLNQLKSSPYYQAGQIQAPTLSAPTMSGNTASTQQTTPMTQGQTKPYGYQDTYWNNYFYPQLGGLNG